MNAFLRTVAMVALVRLAADMLLPEGMMRKLCDVLLGLMMMLCLLRALRAFLPGGNT